MILFDLLRPKWSHSDPAIRLEAVRRLADQNALESIVEHDLDAAVRIAAIRALTNQAVIVRVALSDESATAREAAVARIEDQALLLKIASSDPSATVRAHARAKCEDPNSAISYLREILAKLQVAESRSEHLAEFCGTLEEVCQVVSKDPRFAINGNLTHDEEDAGAARLRDTTQVAWAAAVPNPSRVIARFVAHARQPKGDTPAVAGLTRFFQIKVWRTAENQFDVFAEEKQFSATHDAVAWSRASSGGLDIQPELSRDAAFG
jgi:hypothetical protein